LSRHVNAILDHREYSHQVLAIHVLWECTRIAAPVPCCPPETMQGQARPSRKECCP
jgi:hypothetical protein